MSARGSDVARRLEVLESELYGEKSYEKASGLHDEAWVLFEDVLDQFDLNYFNPGEPVAENGNRSVVIPLTSCNAGNNGGMVTGEEEERILAGEFEIPADLYWARLRAQQARDVLESEEVNDERDSVAAQ